jgi:DNA ligase (NAD+)
LVEAGLVRDVASLYALTPDDLLPLDGFAETKANNAVEAIQASKERPLGRVLAGLGIRGVGVTVAQLLVEAYPSLDALASASTDALEAIPGVGPRIAESVVQWFASPRNQQLIEELEAAGVRTSAEPAAAQSTPAAQPLEGYTFVITGTLPSLSRNEARDLIEAHGGKVTGSVSGNTDYLLCGEKPGSKLAKAEQLGVPVIDEPALRAMIGAS